MGIHHKLLRVLLVCLVFTCFNLSLSKTGHADGFWWSYCHGVESTSPINSMGAGADLAYANWACAYPNSNPPSSIDFKTAALVTVTSHNNNLSCQATLQNIDQHCWGDAFYSCPLGDVRIDKGWCITQIRNPPCNNSCQGGGATQEGDPVEVSTGRLLETKTDWSSGGTTPLTFTRNYSSFTQMVAASANSRLGSGWRSDFDSIANYKLASPTALPSQAVEGDRIHIALPDTNEYSFRFTSGTWKLVLPTIASSNFIWTNYRTDLDYTLTATAQSVELKTDSGKKYTYDTAGKLVKIVLANGYSQTLIYTGSVNSKVIDSFGRSLTFEYWTNASKAGLLKSATGSDGKKISFSYKAPYLVNPMLFDNVYGGDEQSIFALESVVYPDATPAVDTDNPKITYEYLQSVALPYALTAMYDERGVKFAAWTYDTSGRVLTAQHFGGDDLTTFSYDNANNKTTVTNALGRSTVYAFQRDFGIAQRLISVDGIATTGCAASNTVYAFDASGLKTQATDAEGRITKWTRNARNLPLSTIEGFGTPAAKTTTTVWDVARPLPTQIAGPGLTTNLAYNTAGVVTSLSQVDTTTTTLPYSTNGQTRTTAFGYTGFTIPAAPAVAPSGTALSDVALTLVNPGAQSGITGWTNGVGTLASRTGAPCISSACFYGIGTVSYTAMAYQDIAVPAANTAEVDAGKRAAKVSWKQTSDINPDRASMRLLFLSQTGVLLGSATAAQTRPAAWTTREFTGPIPATTRTIRVQMLMERFDGGDMDGYIDDIAVSLVADGAAAALPFLRPVNGDGLSGTITGWTLASGSGISTSTAVPCEIMACFVETGAGTDSFSQTLTIPADRIAEVDGQKRSFELRWIDRAIVAGNQTGVEVAFLNAASVPIAGPGLASPAGGTLNAWTDRVFAADIPALTRSIRITVNFYQPGDATLAKIALTGLSARLAGRSVPQNPVDLLTSVDGPLAGIGDKIVYAYDANGNLSQVTNEVGLITKVMALDSAGRPTTVRDVNNVDTTLAYDPLGRLASITVNPGASQAVTTITYDLSGNVTKVTQPNGAFLQYAWNGARRLTTVTNNAGETITYTYNANGDVTSSVVKSPAAVITRQMTMLYDELGRLMKSLGAVSQTTSIAYDRTDNPVQVTDPRSNLYGYAYDSLSRLVKTTDQEGSQVNLTRDGQDNVVGYADPRSLVTSYVRNGFGEVIRETSPDAGVTTYTRDLRGLVTQMTDGRGVVSNMTYDNAGRLLSVAYPAAVAENVTYSYDLATSSRGKLAKIVDQSGSTEFTYNNLGQITSDKRTVGAKIYTTGYAYDANDHVTRITYPSGRTVSYAYNSLGQMVTVSTKLNTAAANQNIATTVTYVPMANLMTGFTHGNGLVTSATYDLDYRLTSLAVKNGAAFVSSLGYAYGDGMNLTAINDNVVPANNIGLWYNPANRLQNADGSWGQSVSYYDGVGNRTYDNTTVGSVTTTRASIFPASSNRISGMTENAATLRTYTYDAGGNIITDVRPGESFAFTYNKRNRPVSVTRNAVAYATYGYNALEQLVVRSTSAVGGPVGTIHYIYDLDGHLIAEADAITGATTREYIWAAANDNNPIDLPLAVIDGVNTATPATLWVHTDHLGRPTRMTDSTKATVWQAAYKPWGEPTILSGTKLLNLRFPGQYFQIETGLAYNWNRHYDTTTGRYTQPDPLRFVDGPSVYAYAGNSPWMRVDRDGRCIEDACVGEGIIVGCLINPNCIGPIIAGIGAAAGWIYGNPAENAKSKALVEAGGMCIAPPRDAHDPDGAKAPGKPGADEGFEDPKGGEEWVRNPNGKGYGWLDANGNVWIPTGQGGTAHGGSHWDVQGPRGSFGGSVYPGGNRR